MTQLRSVCFVVALLIAGIWSSASAADPARFFPAETDIVISLNVRQLLDSPLVKQNALDLIKTTLAANKSLGGAISALGLDPLTDFDRVSIGMGLDDISSPKAVAVIDGKFDVKKITDVIEAQAKENPKQYGVEVVGGKTIYKIATPKQPVPMYLATISSSVLVFASVKEQLGDAFAAADGTRKPVIKSEVVDLLSKADSKSSLFIVAVTKGKLEALPLPDAEIKKLLDQIQTVSVDLKIEKDARLEMVLGTPGTDQAKKIHEIVGGGLELIKLQMKVALASQPDLQPLLELSNSLAAAQKDKSVVITGQLSSEAAAKMLKKN